MLTDYYRIGIFTLTQQDGVVDRIAVSALHNKSVILVIIFAAQCYAYAWFMSSRGVRPSRSCNLETNKHFSQSGSHTVLVFHTKRYGNTSMGTPNGGIECTWGRQKSTFLKNI